MTIEIQETEGADEGRRAFVVGAAVAAAGAAVATGAATAQAQVLKGSAATIQGRAEMPKAEEAAFNRVSVYVPREITYDLEKMQAVTKNILGQLGCPACHSGHIFDFITRESFVVNQKSLAVNKVLGPGL
ncbi:MAG TPA: hypothetical protein VNH64_01630 [Parvularculaceae bacterium]|nr:hypothetical protein [Parvularculaceae bacterium]